MYYWKSDFMGIKLSSSFPFYKTTNIATTTAIILHLIKNNNLKGNLNDNLYKFTYYMWYVLQYWTKSLVTNHKTHLWRSVIFNLFCCCLSCFFFTERTYIPPFPLSLVHFSSLLKYFLHIWTNVFFDWRLVTNITIPF